MIINFTFKNEDLNYSNEDENFSSASGKSKLDQQTLEPSKACIYQILSYARAYQGFKSEKIGKIEFLLN
jgi:hypothetical protein